MVGTVDLHLDAGEARAVDPPGHDFLGLLHGRRRRIFAVRGLGGQRDLRATLQIDAQLRAVGALREEDKRVENGRHENECGDQPPGSELTNRACHVAPISLKYVGPRGACAAGAEHPSE